MAKKPPTVETEITIRDVMRALDGVSEWVRGIRGALALFDPKLKAKYDKPVAMTNPQVDGCPPDPCLPCDDEGSQTGIASHIDVAIRAPQRLPTRKGGRRARRRTQ